MTLAVAEALTPNKPKNINHHIRLAHEEEKMACSICGKYHENEVCVPTSIGRDLRTFEVQSSFGLSLPFSQTNWATLTSVSVLAFVQAAISAKFETGVLLNFCINIYQSTNLGRTSCGQLSGN